MSTSTTAKRRTAKVRSEDVSPKVPRVIPTEVVPSHASTAVADAAVEEPPKGSDYMTAMLDRYGFDYRLETIDLSEVNRAESQRNQARIAKPIDEDQVILYAEAWKNGDKFPPIVGYRTDNGIIIMDGNHRVAMYDVCDETKAEAFIVRKPAPNQIQAFTFEANTKHGKPTSLNDRLRQAIFMHDRGMSATVAANQLSIPLATLNSAIANAEAERRFQELNIKKFDRLTASARRRLNSIHSNVVMKAAAELSIDAGLSADDITALAKRINVIRNERDQLAAVVEERQSRSGTIKATAGGRIPVPTPLVTLQRITSTVSGLNMGKVEEHLRNMPDDVRADYLRAVARASSQLLDLVYSFKPKS